jgi:hypothetical protein
MASENQQVMVSGDANLNIKITGKDAFIILNHMKKAPLPPGVSLQEVNETINPVIARFEEQIFLQAKKPEAKPAPKKPKKKKKGK